MRKFRFALVLCVSATPAFAGGGMGDTDAHLREMNAICEAQRRGEGPLQPDMCLPRFPPDSPAPAHRQVR